jgi:aryl-alcohol dehydrogenase-like predicted oxidoreductase
MERTELGRTGDVISAIGYGAMGLSVAGRPDRRAAARVLGEVLDVGISFIDSADVYGLDDDDLGHRLRMKRSSSRFPRAPRSTSAWKRRRPRAREDHPRSRFA